MKRSPLSRSMESLRLSGYIAEKVEYWNSWTHTRHDLFGFADIIAARDTPYLEILLVQTTSRGNIRSRIRKIDSLPSSNSWLAAGGTIEVHGWGKVKGGKKVATWSLLRVRRLPSGGWRVQSLDPTDHALIGGGDLDGGDLSDGGVV